MKKRSLQVVVRPWGSEWQLWRRSTREAVWQLAYSGPLSALPIPKDAICALPARLAIAHPFFVEAVEEAVAREMALLEMEMSGLTQREKLARDVEVRLLRREGNKTLVLGIVYPPEWPVELLALEGAALEASPLLAVLSDNAVHLWRENADLVAAVAWGGHVVYWETMHWTEDQSEIKAWLHCVVLQLRQELGIQEVLALKEWVPIFQEVPEDFVRDRSFNESDHLEGAIPTALVQSTWLPGHLQAIALTQRRRATTLKLAGAALAVILFVAAGVSYAFADLHWREQQADAEMARLQEETIPIRRAAERWRHVEAAVDGRFYPVEMLHVVVASLPPRNVRLTVFEMSPEKILVEGEAGNVGAATEFFNRLQESPEASDLSWEMPSPSLQADNTARFVVSGQRREAAGE